MDDRLQTLVEETNRLAKENAAELKKIRKELVWMSVLRVIVWLVLAGVPVFVYLHLVKPPLENVFGSYESLFEGGN
jgi:hypothetical protein